VDSLRRTDTLTVLKTIQDNQLTFSFNIPADFELGEIDVFGKISLDNQSIEQTSSARITSFIVNSGANILYVDNSLAPSQAVPDENVLFSIALYDSGTADLALIPDSTYLEIGFAPLERVYLGGNYNLNAADTTAVTFENYTIPTGVSSGDYSLSLHTVGTTFGTDTITQDIILSDSLTILTPGTLVLSSIQLSDTVVSQGSSDETVSLSVLNSGDAPALIFSADSIQFIYGQTYSLRLNSGQIFPLTINGGDSAIFEYDIFVDPVSAGPDTFRANIGYEDVNSGVSYTASDSSVYDEWRVLSDVSLNIVSLTATDTRVTQGQNGLAVSLEISNTGETGAVVGAADSIGITFLANNNTVTLVSPVLPDTILPASSQTYNFTVDINPSAATGLDSLAGFVIGRNVRTGSVSSVSSSYLDGWDVQTPANIVLTSVFNALSQVNSGQEDLSVEVRLTNSGQATALLDTVGIFGIPGGNITDTLIVGSLPDSLVSGASDTILFNVDVASAYTGILEIDAFSGYRDGNDTTRAFADTGAVTTHTWTVGTEGVLVVDSVFTTTNTMSLGQSDVIVRASIRNAGNASVQMDSVKMLYNGSETHPVLSSVRVLPATLPLLSTGQSFIAEFNLSAASSPLDSGLVALDLSAYGTDAITSSLIDTLNSEQPDTILLQTPAVLQVVSIINPSSVLQGEENIPDTLIIRNNGGATARVTSATLNFQNGNNFYSQQVNSPSFPVDLDSGESDTVEVSVSVLSSAPLGTDSLAGVIQGVELNRAVSLDTTSAYLSSWDVFGSGGINILSVSTPFDSVSTGQDSILVTARVENSGSNTMVVDSLQLSMTQGTYIDSTLYLTPGAVLASGTRGDFNFYVSVDSSSATGIETINASVFATDSVTGLVSDLSADTTASWLIQSRVTIAITSVTPLQASIGQVVAAEIDLDNSGTADLIVDTSLTVLQSSAFSSDLTLTAPLTIAGGGSYTLNFNPETADGASGTHPYTLRLIGTENGSLFDNTYILSDSLTLTAPAQLVIDSLIASTDTVSQGMDTVVTVYVSNPGETDLLLDSLINSPYGQPTSVTPSLPATISGGGSGAYDLVVDIPSAAPTGLIALDAIGLGRDANSDQTLFDSSATAGDSWTVLTSPNVVIDSIYSDSIVVPGQTDIPVTVSISNSGETAVEINTLEILEQIGLYTHRGPSLPVTLAGSSTINLVDTVDVASNSATGIDTLRARISYRNTVSGDTDILTSTETWAWSIQSSSDLVLLSVVAAETEVSLGQDSINVDVRVRNQGNGTATVDTLTLQFASGDTNYAVSGPVPALSVSLTPGADTTFSFNVDVNPTALTGPDILNARMVGTEVASGTPIEVNGALTPDSWTVQERPLVIMDSVTVSPVVASTGQAGLSGRIIITNQAATYRASAQVDSVDLNFLLGVDNVDTNFTIERLTPPVLPFNLPSGASQAIDFSVDVNGNSLDTLFTADGFLSYIDINDGQRTDVSTANQQGSLTVQSTATINILSLTMIPDTVSNGQTGITGELIFENTGKCPIIS
jgi:hypothetical protein